MEALKWAFVKYLPFHNLWEWIRIKPEQYHLLFYILLVVNTNTFMRNKAISLGFKLNEYGLFDKYNDNIFLIRKKFWSS